MCQVYWKLPQVFITNYKLQWNVLHITTARYFITNYHTILSYYKLPQKLLQVTAGVTNYGGLKNYVVKKTFFHFFIFEEGYDNWQC